MNKPSRRFRPGPAVGALAALLSATFALAAFGYMPFLERVNSVVLSPRWNHAQVAWSFYPQVGSNVDTSGGPDVATALTEGVRQWPETPLVSERLNVLAVERGADSSTSDPNAQDCVNVITLAPSSSVSIPTGAVAFARVAVITAAPGQSGPPFTYGVCGGITSDLPAVIFDADIVFNPQQLFSTAWPPPAGRFDVQSVATHEFGHALGLDHNGIARSMMYPFGKSGPDQLRELRPDDAAGVAFLYPAPEFSGSTAVLSGHVRLSGQGVFASHVVAVSISTGEPVLDGLTAPDGSFGLVGVPPGRYHLFAAPLTGPYTLENFSGWVCGYASDPSLCLGIPENPTDYTATFFE
jgi:hypothetical protein